MPVRAKSERLPHRRWPQLRLAFVFVPRWDPAVSAIYLSTGLSLGEAQRSRKPALSVPKGICGCLFSYRDSQISKASETLGARLEVFQRGKPR